MNAIVKLHVGLWRLPSVVKLWLMVLVTVNMVLPLLFWPRIEAKVVLATFMASFMLMMVLTGWRGFTRLLGMGHVLWVPLLAYLSTRVGLHPLDEPYGLWLGSVLALNGISLVFDFIDVARYARGEREEMVSFS